MPHPGLAYGQGSFRPMGDRPSHGTRDQSMALDPLSTAIQMAAMTPPVARESNENTYFLPSQQLVASVLSPLPYTPSSSSLSAIEQPTTCHCLEKLTRLLCQLKNLAQGQAVLGIDALLTGVQQALEPWQTLIQCTVCHSLDDHSTILLSLMSVRVLLRHIQRISFGALSGVSGQSTPEMYASTIGIPYDPMQADQSRVTDVLVVHALRKIKFALHSLKGKFAQARHQRAAAALELGRIASLNPVIGEDGVPISPVDSEPDMDVIQQLFDNLERTVHVVVSALRARNSVPSQ